MIAEGGSYNAETPIKDILPHRYPLLLVDKVVEVVPYQSIIALKNISLNEPVFQGHFPEVAIYPGVYLVEGLAQASAILGCISMNAKANFLLTQIKSARFKKQVLPGDCIYYHVKFEKRKHSFSWFTGTVEVNSEVVASVALSAYMR